MKKSKKTTLETQDQLFALQEHLADTLKPITPPSELVVRMREHIRLPQREEIVSRIGEWQRFIMPRKIWFYLIWPVILFNTIPVCLFGAVFAIVYGRGGDPQDIDLTQPLFWLYFAIFIINWLLAIFVFQKYGSEGKPVRRLFAADGEIFWFRWKHALAMFVLFNGIWVIYLLAYEWLAGGWPAYSSFQGWQKIMFIVLFPLSAGFTEELYWRGFLITEMEAAGQTSPRAVLLAAAGFSLVHGVFLPDKLLVTFLLGLVAGFYYTRERKLLPLMFTHAITDIWSYGISLFAG